MTRRKKSKIAGVAPYALKPRAKPMTKAELNEMLRGAVENTPVLDDEKEDE